MKNTKFNRFTQYHSDVTHASFGIQNWLVKKGYTVSETDEYKVDKLKYKALLKGYYEKYRYLDDNLFDENGRCTSRIYRRHLHQKEAFVQLTFNRFCKFCNRKFNPMPRSKKPIATVPTEVKEQRSFDDDIAQLPQINLWRIFKSIFT